MSELKRHKADIRSSVLRQREQMDAARHAQLSAVITQRLAAMPEYQGAAMVLGYMSFGTEFASRDWLQQVLDDGKHLILPRVDSASKQLELYRVQDLACQMQQGAWGIAEPMPECCERLIGLNAVEFALLPGVAFARDGARLGYGGGYYDKLLARMERRPALVAAAFALQLVDAIPQESTDVKIDRIVTEQESISCSV
ncbi:MAG: 5-formyltetrahydrofolate cyclo-ligase [Gallionella sp.]